MSELGMLSLENRRIYLDLVEVYKILNGHTKLNRIDLFELSGDTVRRATRGNDCPNNIVIQRCNLDVRQHFFTNRVAKSWNTLPTDLKMSRSLSIFKFNLKSHLKNINAVDEASD